MGAGRRAEGLPPGGGAEPACAACGARRRGALRGLRSELGRGRPARVGPASRRGSPEAHRTVSASRPCSRPRPRPRRALLCREGGAKNRSRGAGGGRGPGIGRGSERRGWCVAVLLPRAGSVSRGYPKLSGAGGARMGGARGPPCCAPPGSRSPGTGPPGRGQPRTELRGGGGGPAGAEGTAPGASTPLRLERAVAGLGASRGLPALRSGPGREAPAAFVPPAATGWAGLSARRGSPKEILFSSSLLPFLSLLSSFPFPPFLPSFLPPFLALSTSLPPSIPPSLLPFPFRTSPTCTILSFVLNALSMI